MTTRWIERRKTTRREAFTEEAAWLWAAVVESSNDAIITKSLDGIIRSWNKSAERIFGYTAAEAIGQSVLMLIPEDHVNEEPAIIARIQKGERVDHFETVRRRKDGSLVPISLTISPIRNAQNQIVGASKIARDISNQKEYEQRLITQANELEQFAYVASHDLREPLRKVAVYTELLTTRYRETGGPEATKYAGFISDAVTRMHSLIGDLLDYSRANKMDGPLGKIPLNNVVEQILSDLEVSVKESGARVSVGRLPSVLANRFQIHQVLQNLISNAIKFRKVNSSKGPRIEITGKTTKADVVVSVKDNGIGIDPRYQEKVFRIFQRLHSKQKYPGTGIGLAICKKIIEQYGGRIWAESKPGEGSTFSFSLPRSGPASTPSPSDNLASMDILAGS